MEINVKENEKNMIKVEMSDLTFVNLLNERLWEENESVKSFDYSSFSIDHPYMAKPVLIVKSANPSKAVLDATDYIISDVESLKKQLGKK